MNSRNARFAALLAVAAIGLSCSERTGPTGPQPSSEAVALRITLPESVITGQPFTLAVSARTPTGAPDPNARGTVTLSASPGTLSPASVELENGAAFVQVQLSGAAGEVTITAAARAVHATASTLVLTTAAAVRIDIVPGAVLLPGSGQTMQLVAHAYDADGRRTAAAVTWRTNQPTSVSISSSGLATALAAIGSAQITATAGAVESAPALALVAAPAAGALLVADSQVISVEGIDAPGDYGVGWKYRVRLRGVVPTTGQIVLASGAATVGGRAVAVTGAGDARDVVLETVPLRDLFTHLSIDQAISLDKARFVLADDVARQFVSRNLPQGGLALEPRSRRRWRPAAARLQAAATDVEFRLGPFECTASGSVPELDIGSPKLEITHSLTYHVVYNDALEKLSVTGDIDATFEYNPEFKAEFEGEASCEAVVGRLVVPISGAASWAFAAVVPIGIGMDLEGKLTIAEVGFKAEVSAGATLQLGVSCPGGGGCSPIRNFEPKPVTPSFEFTAPDPTDQFHAELSVYGYALARLAVGSPLSTSLQFELLEGKAGIEQTVDLKTAHAQAADTEYASEFKLESRIELGPGSDLEEALEALGELLGIDLSFSIPLLDDLDPLARSPTGTFTITPAHVAPGDDTQLGDMATFTIELDPVTYFALESVEKVEIFWKKDDGSGGFTLEPGRPTCTTISGSSGQTKFECLTDFLNEHVGEQTFYAFVHAKMFGFTLPIPLEVAADASATATVGATQCGVPPSWAVTGLRDFSTATGGQPGSQSSFDGPDLDYLSVSGGGQSTGTTDTSGLAHWSPELRLSGHVQDYVKVVPLAAVDPDRPYVFALVRGTGKAEAEVIGGTCCGRFDDGHAEISIRSGWFHTDSMGGSPRAAAGSSFAGNLPRHDIREVDAVFRQLLFLAQGDEEQDWEAVGTVIQSFARHRGEGNGVRVSASLTIQVLDVVDAQNNQVPVLICSAAGFDYGASAGGRSTAEGRVVGSRPTRQAGARAPRRR